MISRLTVFTFSLLAKSCDEKRFVSCALNRLVLKNQFYYFILFLYLSHRQKDSVKSLMKAQNLLSINQLMEREIANFMYRYKYCNNHLPAAFTGMLNKNTLRLSSKESRQTRSKSKLFPLFCRIDLTKQCLSYRGPLIWNKIPPTIRENKSFRSFRSFTKQYHQQVLI